MSRVKYPISTGKYYLLQACCSPGNQDRSIIDYSDCFSFIQINIWKWWLRKGFVEEICFTIDDCIFQHFQIIGSTFVSCPAQIKCYVGWSHAFLNPYLISSAWEIVENPRDRIFIESWKHNPPLWATKHSSFLIPHSGDSPRLDLNYPRWVL